MENITDIIPTLEGRAVRVDISARGWHLDTDPNTYTVSVEAAKGRIQPGDRVNRELVDRFRLTVEEPLVELRPVTEARGVLENRSGVDQICVWRGVEGERVGTPLFYKEITAIEEISCEEIGNGPHGIME